MVKIAPTLINGCTYEVSSGGKKATHVKVLGFNAIDRHHTVVSNGKTMRIDLSKYANIKRMRAPTKKSSTENVFLYICDIGNGVYKIGVTASPQRREKQIKTCSSKAHMLATIRIPHAKSAQFRSFEKEVLKQFSHGRTTGGTEVLRLKPHEVKECTSYMRSICARA